MYIAAGPFECKWHNKRVKRTFKIVYSSFALNCPESIRQFPVYRFAYSTVVVFNSIADFLGTNFIFLIRFTV